MYLLTDSRARTTQEANVFGGLASERYTTIDPEAIAAACASEFSADIVQRSRLGMGGKRSPLRHVLRLRPLAVCETLGYRDGLTVETDHRGRSAVRIYATATRLSCCNEFGIPWLVVPHCSTLAQQFATDPLGFVRNVRTEAQELPEKIEALHGVGAASDLISALPCSDRLRDRLLSCAWGYQDQAGASWCDFWSALQALTDVRCVKSGPVLRQNYVRRLLSPESYSTLLQGQVPALN